MQVGMCPKSPMQKKRVISIKIRRWRAGIDHHRHHVPSYNSRDTSPKPEITVSRPVRPAASHLRSPALALTTTAFWTVVVVVVVVLTLRRA